MQRENYINVTPEILIEDEFFLDWVLRNRPEATNFWEDFVQTHPKEKKAVLQAQNFVKALNKSLSNESISEFNTSELWDKIENRTHPKTRSLNYLKWVAAASVILIISWIFLFPKGTQTIKTQIGEIAHIDLPDASKVILNTTSQISYSTENWKESRIINLKGEAFFDVSTGEKFTVITPHGDIIVLGTSFNIQTRNNLTKVACFTGKVAVIDNNGKSEILLPGQKVMVKNTGISSKSASTSKEKILAWQSGVVYLSKVTMQDAINDLEWYFNIEIKTNDAVLSRPIEGFFKTSNLDSALYQVTMPLNLEFEKLPDGVVLIREK